MQCSHNENVITAIPFAFTESFFYPQYWEPVFLFNLIDYIGFGIEDILFVIGLAGFSSTSYAFVTNKKMISSNSQMKWFTKLIIMFALTFVAVFTVYILNIEMIYGAIVIMMMMSFAITIFRIDLIISSIFGVLLPW